MKNWVAWRSWIILLTVMTSSVLVYQNCGMTDFSADSTAFSSYVRGADIFWSGREVSPEINAFGRVTRWTDTKNRALSLYPTLIPGSNMLNTDNSAIFRIDTDPNYLRFEEGAALTNAAVDVRELTSDRYTIAFVIRDIVIPENHTSYGALRVFNLFPTNGEFLGHLVADLQFDTLGNPTLAISQWFNSSYVYQHFIISGLDLTQPMAVAIRFDTDAHELGLAVNGRLVAQNLITLAEPPPLSNVPRTLRIHAVTNEWGYRGSFSLSDFLLNRGSASDNQLVALSQVFYDRAMGRSISGPIQITDGHIPSTDSQTPGGRLYTQHCAGCHFPLSYSSKKGISLDNLNTAIRTRSDMVQLSVLTTPERQAIVDALNSP